MLANYLLSLFQNQEGWFQQFNHLTLTVKCIQKSSQVGSCFTSVVVS